MWLLVLLLKDKARASDGLLLCEVVHNQGRVGFESRRQAKLFLRSGQKKGEVNYQSVETGDKSLKAVLKTADGVSYLVWFDAEYNFKLACIYLDEIRQGFLEEMNARFGGSASIDHRSKLETIEANNSYCFQSFERLIMRKRTEFQDVNSTRNADRLKQEIAELQKIMSENIQLLVDRENSLNSMMTKAQSLKNESKIFKDKSKELVWSLWLRQNSVYMIIAAFFLVFVYLKIF